MGESGSKDREGVTLWSLIWEMWSLFFWGAFVIFNWFCWMIVVYFYYNFDQRSDKAWYFVVALIFFTDLLISWSVSQIFKRFKRWADNVYISWIRE